ncbi:ATP-binding protein [Chryseolinea sp. H1M3-3]|uniref:hybrid sensor histidine kinase/response regulator n=1 Tax=Chryseolinea sp. H1M3-3 TaxID=3034144 RepID=UPI0023EA974F|nr:ATP-binding protein [Chryseolinea sp. H1M3-3]
MQSIKEKLHPNSVKRKVLAGFLLVFVAILLALGITRFGFREMMSTVDQLSVPNEKLKSLNTLFQEITRLDQLQRADAIKNPGKPYEAFLIQSKSMVDKIDSLRLMPWDSTQHQRLLSMKNILNKRNRLFISYLKLRSDLINNTRMSYRLDTLSTIIETEKIKVDTNVVTTEKKVVTTYTKDTVIEQKDQRSRLARLFGRKKKAPDTTQFQVQEEVSVTIDTLSVARQNKALEEVGKIMMDLDKEQRAENRKLMEQELALINSNSLFVTQLLGVLHEVENEELSKMHANNSRAVTVVTQNISRISILLLVFFLGAAVLVYLIWTDITRSNFYKEQLEKAKEEAEELSKIKQRFLANMSHEIRTPLQSIIGFSEQLKNYHGPHLEAVGAINSSSEHLLHIVNEVLDYSRISSGSFNLVKAPFSLYSLLKEVESAMRIQAERKRLTLLLDLEKSSDYQLLGDPFRLRQILYNLIGNAIKFTTKGYVKITLKTKEDKNGVNCTFEIMDTGIGIRQEDLKKIFNQFEQANSFITHNFGGTGLGLTIAKSLAEAQGGSLNVTSEPGHGSTFMVEIKFEKETEKTSQPEITAKTNAAPFSGKVIVVDDDAMILKLCSLILKKNQIEFITYNDAGKLIHQDPDPAVTHIFMDIRMPSINGVDLCHALKERYSSKTVFVALTAHVFSQEKEQLLKEGFDIILSKPFREEELLEVLGVRSAERAVQENRDSIALDLSMLRKITMGDEALFQSILSQFQEETEKDLQRLTECLKKPEAGMIREIVHKLAGRVGQMGARSLSSELHDIENELVEGTPVSELMVELMDAKADVAKLVQSINKSLKFEV